MSTQVWLVPKLRPRGCTCTCPPNVMPWLYIRGSVPDNTCLKHRCVWVTTHTYRQHCWLYGLNGSFYAPKKIISFINRLQFREFLISNIVTERNNLLSCHASPHIVHAIPLMAGLKPRSAAARLLGLRFQIPQGHGSLSLVAVACRQREISASGWSLVQRSPTHFGMSVCGREVSKMKRPWSTRGYYAMGGVFWYRPNRVENVIR